MFKYLILLVLLYAIISFVIALVKTLIAKKRGQTPEFWEYFFDKFLDILDPTNWF